MFEFIKRCFKYLTFSNSIIPENPTKITVCESEESKKVVISKTERVEEKSIFSQGTVIYPISENSEDVLEDVSSQEFDDEKYAISVANKLIKHQRKILNNIKEGKTQINRFVYITLKTNAENFSNILKDIKSKDERDKYTYIYYKDLNNFQKIHNIEKLYSF
jgi:hypothetical protein